MSRHNNHKDTSSNRNENEITGVKVSIPEVEDKEEAVAEVKVMNTEENKNKTAYSKEVMEKATVETEDPVQKEIAKCNYEIAVLLDKINRSVDEVQRGLWNDQVVKLKAKRKSLELGEVEVKTNQVTNTPMYLNKVPTQSKAVVNSLKNESYGLII